MFRFGGGDALTQLLSAAARNICRRRAAYRQFDHGGGASEHCARVRARAVATVDSDVKKRAPLGPSPLPSLLGVRGGREGGRGGNGVLLTRHKRCPYPDTFGCWCTIRLRFDCSSSPLRPFDELLTTRLLRCGLNE